MFHLIFVNFEQIWVQQSFLVVFFNRFSTYNFEQVFNYWADCNLLHQ